MDYQAFFREQDARMNLPDDDFKEYLRRMGTYRRRYACSIHLNLSQLKLPSLLLDQPLATNNTSSNPSFGPVQVSADLAHQACEILAEELNEVIARDPEGSSLISPISASISIMSRESINGGRTRNNFDPATTTDGTGTNFNE